MNISKGETGGDMKKSKYEKKWGFYLKRAV